MKVLVLGSGGREHALVWKVMQSKKVKKIFCAPGNGGIEQIVDVPKINVNDNNDVLAFVKKNKIDLTIVGPEAYLVNGIVDTLEDAGYSVFGPRKSASKLEASKIYTKEFLNKYNIPTAAFQQFNTSKEAINYINKHEIFPIVIKADGLAEGKGVLICKSKSEAKEAVKNLMEKNKFGIAGTKIIIEEFLSGDEISILTFTDSETMIPMEHAKDYKKINENDQGLNTGGMGCISPNPSVTKEIEKRCESEILLPILNALKKEKIDFRGVLFIGIIYTSSGPKVLEFNVRFGDPETQVILPRMKSDIIDIFFSTINKKLSEVSIEWYSDHFCSVVMASSGYPESYKKNIEINGLKDIENCIVFHAGTKLNGSKIFTNGGRVLNVTARGENTKSAIENAYEGVFKLNFKGAYYRKDIGS
ncbi:MAG: phosphoribosylamine--glycine ligase [Candidatus Neomarinimicrobiota bacterium]|nr:phosphoribosylamine--glycine ligase [Candidatus Neomarinimicrobiota bacterium]